MQRFAVTAIDVGETCDGHARLLGLFETREQAEEFVKEDMKDTFHHMGNDEGSIFDETKHEVWADKHYSNGCIWDILDLSNPEEQEKDNGK